MKERGWVGSQNGKRVKKMVKMRIVGKIEETEIACHTYLPTQRDTLYYILLNTLSGEKFLGFSFFLFQERFLLSFHFPLNLDLSSHFPAYKNRIFIPFDACNVKKLFCIFFPSSSPPTFLGINSTPFFFFPHLIGTKEKEWEKQEFFFG